MQNIGGDKKNIRIEHRVLPFMSLIFIGKTYRAIAA